MKSKIAFIILGATIMLAGCGSKNEKDSANDKKTETKVEVTTEYDVGVGKESEHVEKNIGNGSALFSTDFKIEDYCNGNFIVSKSDGLLYGVLDINGREIIPVEYDNIEFMNKEDVVSGKSEDVYIKASYENQKCIYNEKGDKIINEDASVIKYKFVSAKEGEPFFTAGNYDENQKIYSKNGEFLFEIPVKEETNYMSVCWISPQVYLLSESAVEKNGTTISVAPLDTVLKTVDGKILQNWDGKAVLNDGDCNDGKYWTYIWGKDGLYSKITISESGELISQEDGITEETIKKEATSKVLNSDHKIYLGKDKQYVLYTTNNTWKYEDLAGNPVYEDRYFYMGRAGDCFLLSNSDNEVCVLTQNGKKTVDYGVISLQGDNYYYNGDVLGDENSFSDYDSFCYVENNDSKSTVYYFKSE